MKGPQARTVDHQANVGPSRSAGAVDVVLDVAENEQGAILIGKMIDDALASRLGRRPGAADAEESKQTGKSSLHQRSSFHR